MPASPLYRRGDTGPAVAEIRTKLVMLGLLEEDRAPIDSAEFDESCDRAIREFQQNRGLRVDGIVGPQTYRALEEARWGLGDRVLHFSVSHPLAGDDIAQLQHRLLDMGLDPGSVDGVFGRTTEQAVRDLQRNAGLAPDGMCGPATFKALDRLAGTVVESHLQARAPRAGETEAIHQSGPTLAGKIVVIDPGHGHPDRGLFVNGLNEADVVHDVAARIEGRLTAMGATAFLTRGHETDLDHEARARFANDMGADLVVSLHVDASGNPEARGVATYYYGTNLTGGYSATGERFAGLVQREIVARTDLLDCRTHPKAWDLLRMTRMPAIEVDLGYISNPGDAAQLSDPDFRDCLAEAIVVAIQRLYLPPDLDAPTGVLRVPPVRADRR